MEQDETTFRLETPTGSTAYFHYDHSANEVEYNGNRAAMPYDKFIDFIHVAGMVGLKTSKL